MLRIVGVELIKMYCIPHCSKLCISCSNYHSFARITCLPELYFLNSFFSECIHFYNYNYVLISASVFYGYCLIELFACITYIWNFSHLLYSFHDIVIHLGIACCICMSRLTNVLLLIFNFAGYECYCIFTNYKTSKLYNWIFVPDVTI